MQTSPYHPSFVAYQGGGLGSLNGLGGVNGLGALGLDPTAAKAGSAVASYGAGAAATAGATAMGAGGYAAIGSVAGPIGAVVGLVVGIVATKLLTKQYLNVGQMNAAEAAEISAFNQYRTIMGRAPGRQFGLAAMRAVWKGALHSGFFPGNQETQCFHDGCSAHPGNASLIDIALDGGSKDRNTFPDMLPKFRARVTAPAPVMRIQPVVARSSIAARPGLRGFGALGQNPFGIATGMSIPDRLIRPGVIPVPIGYATSTALTVPPVTSSPFPGTPEAVVFIDSFFIPANSSGSPCSGHPCYWAAPSNATEHQILYDVADAYLAQQAFPSTPFVAQQAALTSQQAPAAILPAGSSVPGGMPAVSVRNPVLNPVATPLLPGTPPAVAVGSGVVTTLNAATNANLDAALASQGFRRVATSQDGYPVYQTSSGQTYAYANGQLYAYSGSAQLAVTGSAGNGITTPAGGLDPTTAALISNMLSQGATPAQAASGAANKLAARGVPVTTDVQAQLDYAAANPAAAGITSPTTLLLGLGAVVLIAFVARR